jgi:lysophospholipase L1-like esterase
MGHDVLMNRRLLATIAILILGAVPDRLAGDTLSRVRNSLKSNLFNRFDVERIERGYYERLIDPGQRLDDLADLRGVRLRQHTGTTWSVPFDSTPLVMRVADLREVVLRPSDSIEKWSVRWGTNAQGMRDQSYASEKPAETFRIALVGDSIGAGWGVNADQRFESILERTWNDRSRGASGRTVEILNFAVPGHSPGQRWYHFSQIGWPMHPDLVICEATAADLNWDERRLRYLLARGLAWNSPIYRQALLSAGIEPFWEPDRYRQVLRSRNAEIVSGIYHAMALDCRARGVSLLWLLVPRVGRTNDASDQRALLAIARGAGFASVIDVSDAYDGVDPARLAVASSDFHPNSEGHARLAQRLDSVMRDLPPLRHLWEPTRLQLQARGSQMPGESPVSTALGVAQTAGPKVRGRITPR